MSSKLFGDVQRGADPRGQGEPCVIATAVGSGPPDAMLSPLYQYSGVAARACLSARSQHRALVSQRRLKMSAGDVIALKKAVRQEVASRLEAADLAHIGRQTEGIRAKIISHAAYERATRVSIYISTEREAGTRALLAHALAAGKGVFVPAYSRGAMRMLRLRDEKDLAGLPLTSWGIPQPSVKDKGREDALETGGLDLVIAPGVAFTRDGRRCGHGGGYYDRYLQTLRDRHRDQPQSFLRPHIIGLALTQQLYEDIPTVETDVVLDEVVYASD